jgi:hypothetical protein
MGGWSTITGGTATITATPVMITTFGTNRNRTDGAGHPARLAV